MPLVHGRDITPEELERIVGREFPVRRFASLCNAIIWAVARPTGLAQLAFTGRVFVADNGVDAEWLLDVPKDAVEPCDLIGPGRNVFQYKQRDITSRDRKRTIADLRRDLQAAAREVVARTGPLARYVLLTNIDLTLDEKNQLAEAIGASYQPKLIIRIFGAAELAAALNNLPHIRSSFFATAQFANWSKAWDGHVTASIGGSTPALVGRQLIVDNIRAAIDDDSLRAVLIAGISDIGKSRIVLASTEHRQVDTVFALDPVSLTISDLLALRSPNQPIIVVVEDPDIDRIAELVTTALEEDLKLVLTIPSTRVADSVNYGRDPRLKLFDIQALSDVESEELLRASGAEFDYSVRSWVVDQAGGNPGILLAASSIGQQLRTEGPTFREQVGAALQDRARMLLGDAAIEILRSLSVLTAAGFSGHAEGELQTICRVLATVTPNQVIAQTRALSQAGFLRIRGNYLEVVPPILANYFAEAALAGRPRELVQLFTELSAPPRVRLLRRIRQLRGGAVEAFWNELFERGVLSAFESALADVLLLRLVAPAVPNRVAPLLLRGLQERSIQQRSAIAGSVRRELVWTLDQLLFWTSSSATALRSLSLLAEAENEEWSNNSTGVFTECFQPLHPQLPLPLEHRVAILRELLAGVPTRERKLLAIKAAAAAFDSHGSVMLRRSESAEPFDPTPTLTYEQLYGYLRELIDILRDLINTKDQQVATAAGEVLISGIGVFAGRAQPAEGIGMLEEIGSHVLNGTLPFRLEDFVTTVQATIRQLQAHGDRFREEAARASRLLLTIDEGSFMIRVKRWIGSWELGEQGIGEDGRPEFRGDREIRGLACEAAAHPEILGEQLLVWLLSTEAKRAHGLFYWLGRYDSHVRWQTRIEELGTQKNGHTAFSSYFGGRAALDPAFVDTRLDELSAAGQVTADAIVAATAFIPGNHNAIRRIVQLISENRLNPTFAERHLICGGWMNSLTGDEAFTLLSALAGPQLERAELIIDFLAMWVHSQKPLEGDLRELAWRALESAPQSGEAWDYDLVASTLAPHDLVRAFRLLERLLALPDNRKSWEPLDRHGGNRYWHVLWAADRARSLRLLFDVSMQSSLFKWKVAWHLPDTLDMERDADILIKFGRQNVETATFISSIITAARPGFWPIAVGLLSSFPEERSIQGNIASAAEHAKHVIVGPFSDHYDKCAADVTQAIEREHATGGVRAFLGELARRLRLAAEAERRREADETVNL